MFSTRVFAGIGAPFYQIPPKYRNGSMTVRLDSDVYPLEVMPSIAGILLSTIGFSKETLKNVSIVSRFPRLKFVVQNSSDLRLCFSLLLSSWYFFFMWLKAFLL